MAFSLHRRRPFSLLSATRRDETICKNRMMAVHARRNTMINSGRCEQRASTATSAYRFTKSTPKVPQTSRFQYSDMEKNFLRLYCTVALDLMGTIHRTNTSSRKGINPAGKSCPLFQSLSLVALIHMAKVALCSYSSVSLSTLDLC